MKYLFCLFLFIPFLVSAKTEAVVDVLEMNIYEIQDSIDAGFLTYEQLVLIYLERIEKYDSEYNTIISLNENAIEEARELDEILKNDGKISMLHGIPILVKDNIDVKGLPTTNGASGLLDAFPLDDAEIIKQLKDAGAIILGKTNMSEFGFYATYSLSSFGFVNNAYNPLYSAYGSSGGSAAATALNFAVAAIGGDTSSSIRMPASANNVVGMRPSYDLISGDGIVKYDALKDVAGPITKYVEDNALILEVLDNSENQYNVVDQDVTEIKVGIFESIYNRSSTFIKDLFDIQIENLRKIGVEVEFIDTMYLDRRFNENSTCYDFQEHMKDNSSEIKTFYDLVENGGYTQNISSLISSYCYNDFRDTVMYYDYLDYIEESKVYIDNKFLDNDIDIVIYPTIQDDLIKISEAGKVSNLSYSYAIAPVVGYPSMSVPMGFYEELPYGMEMMAQTNQEELLYQVAYRLQEINNFYVVPELTPSLYEIDSDVDELLELYEKYKDNKDYKSINENVVEFLSNYIVDKNEVNTLIKDYELLEIEIANYWPNLINGMILFNQFLVLVILLLLIGNIFIINKLTIKKKSDKISK